MNQIRWGGEEFNQKNEKVALREFPVGNDVSLNS